MEIIVWIAFLVIYSIFQALGDKKKKQRKKPSAPSSPGQTGKRPSTLQEALREIQEALQQAQQPQSPAPPPQPPRERIPSRPTPRPARSHREPEFHSMEGEIESKNLEAATQFKPKFTERILEKNKTYEDSFPTSKYSDDQFKHAHPDDELLPQKPSKKTNDRLQELHGRLIDRKNIQQAFVLSEILGKPRSLQR